MAASTPQRALSAGTRLKGVYIAAPLIVGGLRWVTVPLLIGQPPGETIIFGVGQMIGYNLVPFLLAYYASGGRRTHNWRLFSEVFGIAALLYPLLWPYSFLLCVLMAFKIAKNRHPKTPWRADLIRETQSR